MAIASNGGAGDDRLDGGDGNDALYGDGMDRYLVLMGDDTLIGGEGSDVPHGDAARATFIANPGPSRDQGSAGRPCGRPRPAPDTRRRGHAGRRQGQKAR